MTATPTPTDMCVLQVGGSYLMLPADVGSQIFALLQAPTFVNTDYNNGYRYTADTYNKVAIEHISQVTLAKMELGKE